jgi:hypothetical protein
MPRFDRTGPWGEGPMTGGGFGYCNSTSMDYRRPRTFGAGGGMGRGFGRIRGWNRGYGRAGGARAVWNGAPYDRPFAMGPTDELHMLQREARAAKRDLDAINKRIQDLESEGSGSEQ